MKLIFLIGTGSFIGGVLRYLLSLLILSKTTYLFPFSTLAVNITGCFVIGLFMGVCIKVQIPQAWELFLTTGILGGFTTFSAFSNESIFLFRAGYAGYALLYILSSVFLGLLVTYLAYMLIKQV